MFHLALATTHIHTYVCLYVAIYVRVCVCIMYAYVFFFFKNYINQINIKKDMKSSDAKASKCHLKISSRMIVFIKLVYLSSVISVKLQ